jgi:hypothetical protein
VLLLPGELPNLSDSRRGHIVLWIPRFGYCAISGLNEWMNLDANALVSIGFREWKRANRLSLRLLEQAFADATGRWKEARSWRDWLSGKRYPSWAQFAELMVVARDLSSRWRAEGSTRLAHKRPRCRLHKNQRVRSHRRRRKVAIVSATF